MQSSDRRFFDFATLAALGLVTLLFISMPGGCGDGDGETAENPDSESVVNETVSEPTAPPMMEIVDPEPGDLDSAPPPENESDDQEDPPEGDENGEEGADEPEAAAPGGVYVVQPGDTLYGIAVQFNVTMDQLMAANNMSDPDTLQVGQELQIP